MKILNLTQHVATDAQVSDGVFEPKDKKAVQGLLTFDKMPTHVDILSRAGKLALIANLELADKDAKGAMIGGAPYLMAMLENTLKSLDIQPVYSFSIRESVEKVLDDGTVKKINTFKHVGFVKVI